MLFYAAIHYLKAAINSSVVNEFVAVLKQYIHLSTVIMRDVFVKKEIIVLFRKIYQMSETQSAALGNEIEIKVLILT
jgi:hypothetical protein